jgi:hypothetical protein
MAFRRRNLNGWAEWLALVLISNAERIYSVLSGFRRFSRVQFTYAGSMFCSFAVVSTRYSFSFSITLLRTLASHPNPFMARDRLWEAIISNSKHQHKAEEEGQVLVWYSIIALAHG